MIKKTPKGNYIFPRLSKFDNLVHSISSVTFGDMNFHKNENKANILSFATASSFPHQKMMFMEQEHTNTVKEVKRTTKFVYKKVDSLITTKKIILNATTADCVPLIFFDPITKTIAVAHSGWRGTYKNIADRVIGNFKKKNVDTKDILVAIGPSIGSCCYDIDRSRVLKFQAKYPKDSKKFIRENKGKYFLDLTALIKLQLVKAGISLNNIEDSGVCTRHAADFFSFRRQNNFGNTKVFMTSVGLL